MSELWLRRGTANDVATLHALLATPEVNRYLADGVAPPLDTVQGWLTKSDVDFEAAGVGVWLLGHAADGLAGCVRLEVDADARVAELVYLLAPRVWGRGLATRIAATAVVAAFESGAIDRIFAGADRPNHRSLAVMERLGMRFARDVQYPEWPGVEYELRAGDPEAATLRERIELIPVLGDGGST
jgi:ribosomal-protein-alanine N-acetyltransferase